MVSELSSRRSSFHEGRKIRLADGQMWTFIVPPMDEKWPQGSSANEFEGLMKAIQEAENDSEQRIAELALAIFLLRQNYCLEPTDFEHLLDFPPQSLESSNWQHSFHQVVQDHLDCFWGPSKVSMENGPGLLKHGWFSRLAARLRNNLLFRW
jgi:hypothetical protein